MNHNIAIISDSQRLLGAGEHRGVPVWAPERAHEARMLILDGGDALSTGVVTQLYGHALLDHVTCVATKRRGSYLSGALGALSLDKSLSSYRSLTNIRRLHLLEVVVSNEAQKRLAIRVGFGADGAALVAQSATGSRAASILAGVGERWLEEYTMNGHMRIDGSACKLDDFTVLSGSIPELKTAHQRRPFSMIHIDTSARYVIDGRSFNNEQHMVLAISPGPVARFATIED